MSRVSFAALIILVISALLRSRIILTPQEVVVRRLFGRGRGSRSRVAEVMRATIVAPGSRAPQARHHPQNNE